MALTLSSSSPQLGATGVALNPPLYLKFNSSLDSSTVSKTTIFVRDVQTEQLVKSVPTIDPTDPTKVTLTLLEVFKAYSSYELVAVGADLSSTNHLKNSSGESLTTTVTIRFSTGESLISQDTNWDEKTSGDYAREGDLFLPSNVKLIATELRLIDSNPASYAHNVDYTAIWLKFSKPISGLDISIDFEPMMQGYVYYSGAFHSAINPPSGTFVISQSDPTMVYFSGAASGFYNYYVTIELGTGIVSTDGDNYPGSYIYFNTLVYPNFVGLHELRREIPAVSREVRDDYLGFLLWKNALYCWEKASGSFSLSNPPRAAKLFALYQTIVDVLDDKELEKSLAAGTRRQLGSLNISVDALVGKAALKHDRALRKAELAMDTILKNIMVKRADIGPVDIAVDSSRLWWGAVGKYRLPQYAKYQPNVPNSNLDFQRQAKVPPYWWWR